MRAEGERQPPARECFTSEAALAEVRAATSLPELSLGPAEGDRLTFTLFHATQGPAGAAGRFLTVGVAPATTAPAAAAACEDVSPLGAVEMSAGPAGSTRSASFAAAGGRYELRVSITEIAPTGEGPELDLNDIASLIGRIYCHCQPD